VARGMGSMIEINEDVLYVLNGVSRDIETIVKNRSWMEDEVRKSHGDFSNTKLITDYHAKENIFEFKIIFYK
jgi:hypothetical protein